MHPHIIQYRYKKKQISADMSTSTTDATDYDWISQYSINNCTVKILCAAVGCEEVCWIQCKKIVLYATHSIR